EMQPRPLALAPAAGVARFPGITVHEQNEALVGLGIPHVAHPDDSILKVSRNDLEIFAVERQELEIGHGSLVCDCVSHACTSGHYGSKVQAYSDAGPGPVLIIFALTTLPDLPIRCVKPLARVQTRPVRLSCRADQIRQRREREYYGCRP